MEYKGVYIARTCFRDDDLRLFLDAKQDPMWRLVCIKNDLLFFYICEPRHEKTNNLYLRIGLTRTELYSYRGLARGGNFGFRK